MGNCEEKAGLKGEEAERAYSQRTTSTESPRNNALSEWRVPGGETRLVSAYSALSSVPDILICTGNLRLYELLLCVAIKFDEVAEIGARTRVLYSSMMI